jgi:hypothetical protein
MGRSRRRSVFTSEASEGVTVDTERWLGRPLPKRFGIWPGGLRCALTVDTEHALRPEMLPLEIWTREGEHLIFHEHRADRNICPS